MRRTSIAVAALMLVSCTAGAEQAGTPGENIPPAAAGEVSPPDRSDGVSQPEEVDLSELSANEAVEHFVLSIIEAGADRFAHETAEKLFQEGIGRVIETYGLDESGGLVGVPAADIEADEQGVWKAAGNNMVDILTDELERWRRIEPLLETGAYDRPEIDRLSAALAGNLQRHADYFEAMMEIAESSGAEYLVGEEAMKLTMEWDINPVGAEELKEELFEAIFALPADIDGRLGILLNEATADIDFRIE